eukprot:2331486-Rhodomonas_salina.1
MGLPGKELGLASIRKEIDNARTNAAAVLAEEVHELQQKLAESEARNHRSAACIYAEVHPFLLAVPALFLATVERIATKLTCLAQVGAGASCIEKRSKA